MEASAAKAHSTLAEAARERRDIVSGEVREEARLIRFVVGPEGLVVPDLARKLPGRGLWVAADRASVETAARKGLFARAAKAKVQAPADLADQVENLFRRRLLSALGLARKSGDLTSGFEKVSSSSSPARRPGWSRLGTAPPTAAASFWRRPGSNPSRPRSLASSPPRNWVWPWAARM